jgi:hypothetical protein
MGNAETYFDNAENCTDLAENAKDEPTRARFRRMAEAWLDLAREQEWLDGEVPPVGAVDGATQKTTPLVRRRIV